MTVLTNGGDDTIFFIGGKARKNSGLFSTNRERIVGECGNIFPEQHTANLQSDISADFFCHLLIVSGNDFYFDAMRLQFPENVVSILFCRIEERNKPN